MITAADFDPVHEEIFQCLDPENPKSFFLFAGAGSGKTRALVEVLKKFREEGIHDLRLEGRKVAIITYTNAACDEIKRRLDYDAAFSVSTIHSFSWELIKPYQHDIREWLRKNLREEIAELEEKQEKGRPGRAAQDRLRKIEAKEKRLASLKTIKKFTYNPNGENSGRDSLNHAEVIKMAAGFLLDRPLMQKILVLQFPILLIDESQDTQKDLIEVFFKVQSIHAEHFALGLFGDTMQRIYFDGKADLGQNIPEDWARPAIKDNHRCPRRIVTLINKIRSDVDEQVQETKKADEGFVRLFIVDTSSPMDKTEFENTVAKRMAKITGDQDWKNPKEVKLLTLEHHMAVKRGDFSGFFEPLYARDRFRTGLLDGTLSGISLFANLILPLIKAKQNGDEFAVARIVRKHSPLLKKGNLKDDKSQGVSKASDAVEKLHDLWKQGGRPSLHNILKETYRSGLFQISESLLPIAQRSDAECTKVMEKSGDDSDRDKEIEAWDKALESPFSQFENYVDYISDKSRFGTHQGIKGLEFPRVMVILDDEEARGFSFSYDKLLGAKQPTNADSKNVGEGKETSIDRTRRLFYVTCSRAEKSLAIVAYTKEPAKVKSYMLERKWFEENEIV
uniref:DNA 3'-5' helicase II n=1 Tax=Candidatus Kentrum sp. FW TaxID=2126338 RepID=A0A450TQV2_9GAMM|nr:MAG: DNA helicase-2 / ATP-dependent DNA helicase PcrA [Candidatus Kentron sp. FW]